VVTHGTSIIDHYRQLTALLSRSYFTGLVQLEIAAAVTVKERWKREFSDTNFEIRKCSVFIRAKVKNSERGGCLRHAGSTVVAQLGLGSAVRHPGL